MKHYLTPILRPRQYVWNTLPKFNYNNGLARLGKHGKHTTGLFVV